MHRAPARAALAIRLALVFAALAPARGQAEEAWVRGAAPSLRAGASSEHAWLGSVPPGERIEVLETKGEWARIRRSDGKAGWIASAFLAREGPPEERIARLEAEVAELRRQLEAAGRAVDDARRHADEQAQASAGRADQLDRIRRENEALRAGARWPEWITGALILSTGMALGAAVRGVQARRRQPRLRL